MMMYILKRKKEKNNTNIHRETRSKLMFKKTYTLLTQTNFYF